MSLRVDFREFFAYKVWFYLDRQFQKSPEKGIKHASSVTKDEVKRLFIEFNKTGDQIQSLNKYPVSIYETETEELIAKVCAIIASISTLKIESNERRCRCYLKLSRCVLRKLGIRFKGSDNTKKAISDLSTLLKKVSENDKLDKQQATLHRLLDNDGFALKYFYVGPPSNREYREVKKFADELKRRPDAAFYREGLMRRAIASTMD